MFQYRVTYWCVYLNFFDILLSLKIKKLINLNQNLNFPSNKLHIISELIKHLERRLI